MRKSRFQVPKIHDKFKPVVRVLAALLDLDVRNKKRLHCCTLRVIDKERKFTTKFNRKKSFQRYECICILDKSGVSQRCRLLKI